MQFNKYRGRLPPKGSMIQCAFDCISSSSCHCIGLNIQTSECHFFGLDESPTYDSWLSASSNTGSNAIEPNGHFNLTNHDFIFFSRDIFIDDSYDKVDISIGRKIQTSFLLEHDIGNQMKKGSTSKGKGNKETTKTTKTKFNKPKLVEKRFPFPWIQFEFKDNMYITEIVLLSNKENENELNDFIIRVGNESITKYYEGQVKDNEDDGGTNWSNLKPFEKNHVCFRYPHGQTLGGFSMGKSKKPYGLIQRTVKCQPCGLTGRYVTIQAFKPCTSCKYKFPSNESVNVVETPVKKLNKKGVKSSTATINLKSIEQQQFPLPFVSIQVHGYPITSGVGKGRTIDP